MDSSCFLLLDVRIVLNVDGFPDVVLEETSESNYAKALAGYLQDNEDDEKILFYSILSTNDV
jgi:hypothetical protein